MSTHFLLVTPVEQGHPKADGLVLPVLSVAVRTRLLPLPPPRSLDRLVRATQHLDPTARQSSRMGLVCMG